MRTYSGLSMYFFISFVWTNTAITMYSSLVSMMDDHMVLQQPQLIVLWWILSNIWYCSLCHAVGPCLPLKCSLNELWCEHSFHCRMCPLLGSTVHRMDWNNWVELVRVHKWKHLFGSQNQWKDWSHEGYECALGNCPSLFYLQSLLIPTLVTSTL